VVDATAVIELKQQAVMLMRHRFNEFVNGSHRFEMNRNWAIFRDDKVPEERGGAHPKWTRLFSQGFIMRDK
jgi:hypothetical protein